ncbi:MAG TPA: cyclic nucleotide-binding domain-containing protein [Roseiflexaceae bacterium]|nr:cyclic nucleotide-binding domain-containing protein [Roseiflexaceae bacterium]
MSASLRRDHTPPGQRPVPHSQGQLSEERLHRQISELALLDCLQGVPQPTLERLATLGWLRAFLPGSQLLHEGEAGAFLNLLLRGTIRLTLHDRAKHEVLVGVLSRGDCFGEGPLFGDLLRGATVQTETICYLVQLPLDQMRLLMAEDPALDAALRRIYRQRKVEWSLGRVPLFSQLSPLERTRIAQLLQPRSCARGELILRAGEPGRALVLIEAGQVVVERAGEPLAYFQEGDFVGEMSLLAHQPHNADVRAVTPVEVLELPAEEFARLLERQPALAAALGEVAERRRAARSTADKEQQLRLLGRAVERGLLRGSYLLVRDPKLCDPHCRRCEDACTARHGSPRLRPSAELFGDLDVTDTCRQCRFGAECVEACPVDAIQWNERGALLITDGCTGCGECVAACPYDAVQMLGRAGEERSPLWMLWGQLQRLARPTIPLEPTGTARRAAKCDLCHGHDDLACISACPTGALRLTPVEEIFPL